MLTRHHVVLGCFLSLAILAATGCWSSTATSSTPSALPKATGPAPELSPADLVAAANILRLSTYEVAEKKLQLPGADELIPAWVGKYPDPPFDVEEFLHLRTPSTDDAAPLYLLALSQIGNDLSFLDSSEEAKALFERKRALQLAIEELSKSDSEHLNDKNVVEKYRWLLEQVRPCVELIDLAQQHKECIFVSGLDFRAQLSHVQAARGFGLLSQLEMADAALSADFSRAERALVRMLRLSRDLRPRAGLIAQLVANVCDSGMFESMRTSLLTSSELTVEQCDQLLLRLQEHEKEMISPLDEAVRMEYVYAGSTLWALETGCIPVEELSWSAWDKLPLNRLNYRLEWSELNQRTATRLANADRPVRERFQAFEMSPESTTALAHSRSNSWTSYIPWKLSEPILIDRFWMSPAGWAEAELRRQTNFNATLALLAVRRYQLQHAALPEKLEAAVREAKLQDVPVDPYDGNPLRYLIKDGVPTVYSIGTDRKDDGGDSIVTVENPFGAQHGNIQSDIVFTLNLKGSSSEEHD